MSARGLVLWMAQYSVQLMTPNLALWSVVVTEHPSVHVMAMAKERY